MDIMIRVATTGGLLSWDTGQQQSDGIRKIKILIELTKTLDRLELKKRISTTVQAGSIALISEKRFIDIFTSRPGTEPKHIEGRQANFPAGS